VSFFLRRFGSCGGRDGLHLVTSNSAQPIRALPCCVGPCRDTYASLFVVAFTKVDVFTLEFGARAAEVEHARFNSHISRPTVAARRLPSLKFHSQVALMGRHVAQASRIHARIFPVQHLYSKHARRPLRRVGGLSWNTPIQDGRSHLAIARWCFRRKTTWWLRPREEILRRTRSRRRIWSAFFLMVAGEYSCLLVRI